MVGARLVLQLDRCWASSPVPGILCPSLPSATDDKELGVKRSTHPSLYPTHGKEVADQYSHAPTLREGSLES